VVDVELALLVGRNLEQIEDEMSSDECAPRRHEQRTAAPASAASGRGSADGLSGMERVQHTPGKEIRRQWRSQKQRRKNSTGRTEDGGDLHPKRV
jgi:hypothetical protein